MNATTSSVGGRAPPRRKLPRLARYRWLAGAHDFLCEGSSALLAPRWWDPVVFLPPPLPASPRCAAIRCPRRVDARRVRSRSRRSDLEHADRAPSWSLAPSTQTDTSSVRDSLLPCSILTSKEQSLRETQTESPCATPSPCVITKEPFATPTEDLNFEAETSF